IVKVYAKRHRVLEVEANGESAPGARIVDLCDRCGLDQIIRSHTNLCLRSRDIRKRRLGVKARRQGQRGEIDAGSVVARQDMVNVWRIHNRYPGQDRVPYKALLEQAQSLLADIGNRFDSGLEPDVDITHLSILSNN